MGLAADAPPVEYMAELKFDGLAISLRYEKRPPRRGGDARRRRDRRGRDGEHANDSRDSAVSASGLHTEGPRGARRGVHESARDFETLNAQQRAAGQKEFINPRNAAAGAVRQLDPAMTANVR